MANTIIQLKKSGLTGNTPAVLNSGELAINYADGKLYYKNAVGGITYITNQQSFATINSNSSLILATSGSDTLSIVPGNNISISTNTTTKTITISSTATGGGSGAITFAANPPASGNTTGDRWVDSGDGTEYTYVNDGTSYQWVDLTTPATASSIGGGSANTILYQTAVGNTGFTAIGTSGQLLSAGVGGIPTWINPNTVGATITDDVGSATTQYPLFSTLTSGTLTLANTSSTKLSYVASTGTLSATVMTATSDRNLKENIWTIQNAVQTVKSLRGVEYTWKENGIKSMGVIAQELETVLPYLVSENENGKSVMYSNMIGLLIEAIKEQQIQIDELKGKINGN